MSDSKKSEGTFLRDLESFVEDKCYMVRDCDNYKSEYKECKSFKGRFQQYYVLGEFLDCSKWKEDFNNCEDYVYKDDLLAGASIIRHEMERLEKRQKANLANDVWEKRTEPPANWNAKLPEWLEEKQKNSFTNEYKRKESCIIS